MNDVQNIIKGSVICLKANPEQTGAVVDIVEPKSGEKRYSVFHDGIIATYYASQIQFADLATQRKMVSPAELHAALSAIQLHSPSISHLYSLFASRIQFVPYQFRPVLKLIQSDRPRLLIADQVGVGKTIEAGLILKELQARRDIQSVLVICPKPLVAERKWFEEMKRFDENFAHLDGDTLRYCIEETHLDGVWPQRYAKAILPYSLLDESLLLGNKKGQSKKTHLLELDPPPTFDLVIVDEAHHIRNTDTWAYRNVRYFCDNAEAVVFLSATPVQMGDNDLFNLLQLLRPDLLTSRQDFDQMAEPNPYLNMAVDLARTAEQGWQEDVRKELKNALATPWGRGVLINEPQINEVFNLLNENEISDTKRLILINKLESLYTFSHLINRTRRRDIGSFTTRKPCTILVDFTAEQRDLHDELLGFIGRVLAFRHGDQNLKFMLSTVRRQVASCVFGLAPLLEGILQRHLSSLELSELGDEESADDLSEVFRSFHGEVDILINNAKSLPNEDPKYDAFLNTITDKQKLANNKLLVFSSFRHTLAYLVKRLGQTSIRIGLIHGDVPDSERRQIRNRFSLPKENSDALDVLLSSEVGCEGLDYQFCDALVNYDLPWNPMRVEQRIGRIDRYGQKSEAVVINNLITTGTIDADIYERCLLRIGIFQQAIGGCEEILGRITREITNIAENFTLTQEEQAARLQQIADNEIRAIQEKNKLEEDQSKFFGISVPHKDDEMIKQASSFWLAPSMLANLVQQYLEGLGMTRPSQLFGSKPISSVQVSREARDALLADFRLLKQRDTASLIWERWLKGSNPHLSLTFDQATAAEQPDLIFITPVHALSKQAAQKMQSSVPIISDLLVKTNDVPSGRYTFSIYKWHKLGLKEDFVFQPVCNNSEVLSDLLTLLEKAIPCTIAIPISEAEEAELEKSHYQAWSTERAQHIDEVVNLVKARMGSLKVSHYARLALLQGQRDEATDSRIRRMRDSQIESADRDFENRMIELKKAQEKGDVLAEAVAFGVLVVEKDDE